MERAIKQRILGALVLAAGCAILVPVVLDGSGTLHQWREVPLPARPNLPMPTTAQLPWTPPPAVASLPPAPAPAPLPIPAPIVAPAGVLAPAAVTTAVVTATPTATAVVAAPVHPAVSPASPTGAPKAQKTLKSVPETPVQAARLAPPTAVRAVPEQSDPVDMLPDMWTVQVASLTSEAAASSFKHQLEQAHQHVYTRHVGKAYKVYVGPELSRTEAEKTKQTLRAQGLQGWLQPYVVQ